MATAGSINIFVNAVTKNFDKNISGVRKQLHGLTRGFADISGAINVAQQAFNAASGAVNTLVGELKRLDDIGDLAARFNITADAVQRLQRTFELSGGQADALSRILARLQVNLGDAANGNGGAAKALNVINLNAKELVGLSLDQAFERIVRQISQLPTPAERAAVATDLFGKSASEIFEIFTRKNVFEDAAKDVDEFGTKLDDVRLNSISKAVEDMERLTMAWKSLKAELSASFAPLLSQLFDDLSEKLRKDQEVFEAFGKWLRDARDIIEFMVRMDREQPFGDKINFAAQVERDERRRLKPISAWIREDHTYALAMSRSTASLNQMDSILGRMFQRDVDTALREWTDILSGGLSLNAPSGAANPNLPGFDGPLWDGRLARAIGVQALTPGSGVMAGRAGALEFGTEAAFSAVQQSRREDEASRLQRQQLEEAKKTNRNLEKLINDPVLNQEVLEPANLQG